MPIKTVKMGPGTLKLGAAGVQDVSFQVRAFRVTASEEVTSTEAIPVLTGDEVPAEEDVTYTWQVSGTLLQDIDAAGIVAYTWTNKGEVVDFEFIPNTVADRAVTGVCRVIPLELGGDVKTRNSSDFTWRAGGDYTDGLIVDDPILAAAP